MTVDGFTMNIRGFRVCAWAILCAGWATADVPTPVPDWAPPKPATQYLIVSYGWLCGTPGDARQYFLKVLQEQRDHCWMMPDSEPISARWVPVTTRSNVVLCSVEPDGSNRREEFTIPESAHLPVQKLEEHYGCSAAMLPDGRFIISCMSRVLLVASNSVSVLATQQKRGVVTEIQVSPDGRYLCGSYSNEGLALLEIATGVVSPLVSGQCMSPRWSPDGKQVLYIQTSTKMTAEFRVADVASRETTLLLKENCFWGFPTGVHIGWTAPDFIWLRREYAHWLPVPNAGLSLRPTPAFLDCEATSSVVVREGLYLRRSPAKNRMGYHPGSIEMVTDAASSVDTAPRILFAQGRRVIEVASESGWGAVLNVERDADGTIW